jgi:quinol monooxygenase YgiN
VGKPFTAGDWLAKEGREQEFADAWTDLAEWTSVEVPGSGWALLLRDSAHPRRFLSIGPWESIEAVDAWRSNEGFRTRVTRIRALVDDFQPQTLELVTEVGAR